MISQPQHPVVKMTAQEKEAQIMKEIRANNVKYESKFEGSFLGQVFGFAVKSDKFRRHSADAQTKLRPSVGGS
ncbi:hypothetical protein G9P44_001180 [Scheffersomyces stipitis]|nr:hypothetical protein G9P44_001180 [Scheffersomyces stipitis]